MPCWWILQISCRPRAAVIFADISHFFVRAWVLLLQGTDKYVLRMADDDWDPDLDFPGLDSSAVITDVGVDQFVLCHQVRCAACFGLLREVELALAPAFVLRVTKLHSCPDSLWPFFRQMLR